MLVYSPQYTVYYEYFGAREMHRHFHRSGMKRLDIHDSRKCAYSNQLHESIDRKIEE